MTLGTMGLLLLLALCSVAPSRAFRSGPVSGRCLKSSTSLPRCTPVHTETGVTCAPYELWFASSSFTDYAGPPVTDADKLIMHLAYQAKRCFAVKEGYECEQLKSGDTSICVWNSGLGVCQYDNAMLSPFNAIASFFPPCADAKGVTSFGADVREVPGLNTFLSTGEGTWESSWYGTCLTGMVARLYLLPCVPNPPRMDCMYQKPDGFCTRITMPDDPSGLQMCARADDGPISRTLFDGTVSEFALSVLQAWEFCGSLNADNCETQQTFSIGTLGADLSQYAGVLNEVAAHTNLDPANPLATIAPTRKPSPTNGNTGKGAASVPAAAPALTMVLVAAAAAVAAGLLAMA